MPDCATPDFQYPKGEDPFEKGFFPLDLFPKTFKSFRKMAWKKPFFKTFQNQCPDA